MRLAGGPQWISSFEAMLDLRPAWLIDAHGSIFSGIDTVRHHLQRNLDFLNAIHDRVRGNIVKSFLSEIPR